MLQTAPQCVNRLFFLHSDFFRENNFDEFLGTYIIVPPYIKMDLLIGDLEFQFK